MLNQKEISFSHWNVLAPAVLINTAEMIVLAVTLQVQLVPAQTAAV